jgi:hypothetical protein
MLAPISSILDYSRYVGVSVWFFNLKVNRKELSVKGNCPREWGMGKEA